MKQGQLTVRFPLYDQSLEEATLEILSEIKVLLRNRANKRHKPKNKPFVSGVVELDKRIKKLS